MLKKNEIIKLTKEQTEDFSKLFSKLAHDCDILPTLDFFADIASVIIKHKYTQQESIKFMHRETK
jgi:hypothetical protein